MLLLPPESALPTLTIYEHGKVEWEGRMDFPIQVSDQFAYLYGEVLGNVVPILQVGDLRLRLVRRNSQDVWEGYSLYAREDSPWGWWVGLYRLQEWGGFLYRLFWQIARALRLLDVAPPGYLPHWTDLKMFRRFRRG